MHSYIASATYRGFARRVNQQHETRERRVTQLTGQSPKTRAAWHSYTLRALRKLPSITVLSETVEGEGQGNHLRGGAWQAINLTRNCVTVSLRGPPQVKRDASS